MHKYFAKTQLLGKKVIFLSQCHSTNDEARAYIQQNPDFAEGITIITSNQTNGRGQRGNNWISPPHVNATFSILLRPKFLSTSRQFDLNIIISIGIHRALTDILGDGVSVKWPNDIFVGNNKLGGILIESFVKGEQISSSIVGIGININQTIFQIEHATSLRSKTGASFEINDVIERILLSLEKVYQSAQNEDMALLKAEYARLLYKIHKQTDFQIHDRRFQGIIKGVTDNGKLIVEESNAISTYEIKEISMII